MATPETMQAWVLDAPNEWPHLKELPRPQPGPGQALVRLQAAALNRRDVWICRGKYPGIVLPAVLGSDGAGTVQAVHDAADAAWVGQAVVLNPSLNWGPDPRFPGPRYEILGMPSQGTLAQWVVVPTANLAPQPPHLSPQQAAAMPLAGLTAWRALFTRAQLQPGEKVLVTGIGSGTAQWALQLALAQGAKVWATSSRPEKLAAAVALGAQGGVLYSYPDWDRQLPGGFDVIVDSAGGEGLGPLVKLLGMGGRLVFFGGTQGKWPPLSPQHLFYRQVSLLGSTMGSDQDFAALLEFVNRHRLVPVLDSVLPWAEAPKAFERMEAGQQTGKLVVQVD